MQKNFEQLMVNTYSLENPMPVVSVTEPDIYIEKGMDYSGEIEITNIGTGVLSGTIEAANKTIFFNQTILQGNYNTVLFYVDPSICQTTGSYEEQFIFTYNGGEIFIPIFIKVQEKQSIFYNKSYIPKTREKGFDFYSDQQCYHPEEKGAIFFENGNGDEIEVQVDSPDDLIKFEENKFTYKDHHKVNFHFSVNEADKISGRVLLKTHPRIQIPYRVTVKTADCIREIHKTLFLSNYAKLHTNKRIEGYKEYRALGNRLAEDYCKYILSPGKQQGIGEQFFELFRALLNYDRTIIENRLLYCFLLLEERKIQSLLKQIKEIDQFLIYYDQEVPDVADLLFVFLKRARGENIQDLIQKWAAVKPEHLFKLLVKNRWIEQENHCYEDYKAMYSLGIKSRFLFLEATLKMNQSPKTMVQKDRFYKALLKWALRRNVIGVKWLKKIENNYKLLIQNQNMDEDIARKIYELDESKDGLSMLCSMYIESKKVDMDAFLIFEKGLMEKCKVMNLEKQYIISAYHCNQKICLEYIKMNSYLDILECTYKSYFYLNLWIQKQQFKSLFLFFEKRLHHIKPISFRDLYIPTYKREKELYLVYLLKHQLLDIILELFYNEKLGELSKGMEVEIVKSLYPSLPNESYRIARKAYKNGNHHPFILNLLAKAFQGSLETLFELYHLLQEKGIESTYIEEEIIYKGVLTRKYSQHVIRLYLNYYKNGSGDVYINKWAQSYIIAQILLEDFSPNMALIRFLEEGVARNYQIPLALALLKAYTKVRYKNNKMIHDLIERLDEDGIIFSWYLPLVPDISLEEKQRIQHTFEYYGQSGQSVYFNYRVDHQTKYQRIEMKDVAIGLYHANIILFFKEGVQYYIEEVNEEGIKDIKKSDYFVMEKLIEQQDTESLFDFINTIRACIEMKDDISLERSITHCLRFTKGTIKRFQYLNGASSQKYPLGKSMKELNQYKKAQDKSFDPILEHNIGISYVQKYLFNGAERAFCKSLEYSDRIEIHLSYIRLLIIYGRTNEALERALKLLEVELHPDLLFECGLIYEQRGDYENAIQFFLRAYTLKENSRFLYKIIEVGSEVFGKDFIDPFLEALQLKDKVIYYRAKANLYFKEERYEDAIHILKLALDDFDDSDQFMLLLARAYRLIKNWKQAKKIIKKVFESGNLQEEHFFELALIEKGIGNREGYEENILKLIGICKDYVREIFSDQ